MHHFVHSTIGLIRKNLEHLGGSPDARQNHDSFDIIMESYNQKFFKFILELPFQNILLLFF